VLQGTPEVTDNMDFREFIWFYDRMIKEKNDELKNKNKRLRR